MPYGERDVFTLMRTGDIATKGFRFKEHVILTI